MCALGMAEEFKGQVAVNTLWPRTYVATAAIKYILGGDENIRRSRKPEIVSDAAYKILCSDFRTNTGKSFIDEDVLQGVDLTKYNVDPSVNARDLIPDGYID